MLLLAHYIVAILNHYSLTISSRVEIKGLNVMKTVALQNQFP